MDGNENRVNHPPLAFLPDAEWHTIAARPPTPSPRGSESLRTAIARGGGDDDDDDDGRAPRMIGVRFSRAVVSSALNFSL